MKRKKYLIIPVLFLLLVLACGISMFTGTINIKPFSKLSEQDIMIIMNIRLPRLLLGIIAGTGLSVAGAIFQGLMCNPLADPFILGTSSGAGLGAVIAIILGLSSTKIGIPAFSFLFALFSLIIVYNISGTRGKSRTSMQSLMLAGVIVSSFFSAVMMLVMSMNRKDIGDMVFWIMGNLLETDYTLIGISGALVVISAVGLMFYSRDMNVLTLGEETASQLGIDVDRTRKTLFLISSLLVGAVVSVSGIIGFIGLVVPHIVRLVTGPDHRILVPSSAIAGSILLVLSDTLARTVAAPLEIPVGVVTAMIGAPFFLYLLRKRKDRILGKDS